MKEIKCGKNIGDMLAHVLIATFWLSPDFDVICDLQLNKKKCRKGGLGMKVYNTA